MRPATSRSDHPPPPLWSAATAWFRRLRGGTTHPGSGHVTEAKSPRGKVRFGSDNPDGAAPSPPLPPTAPTRPPASPPRLASSSKPSPLPPSFTLSTAAWHGSLTALLDDRLFAFPLHLSVPYCLLVVATAVALASPVLVVLATALRNPLPSLHADLLGAVSLLTRTALFGVLPFAYLYAEAGSPVDYDAGYAMTVLGHAPPDSDAAVVTTTASGVAPGPGDLLRRRRSADDVSSDTNAALLRATAPDLATTTPPSTLTSRLHLLPPPGAPRGTFTRRRLTETLLTLAGLYGLALVLVFITPTDLVSAAAHWTLLVAAVGWVAPAGVAATVVALVRTVAAPSDEAAARAEVQAARDAVEVIDARITAAEGEGMVLDQVMAISAKTEGGGAVVTADPAEEAEDLHRARRSAASALDAALAAHAATSSPVRARLRALLRLLAVAVYAGATPRRIPPPR
ncbi:hypothetical protein H9P43_009368 [Blastocladiella emersonii ATCC 22665]|nr:hypothetical protein H9P43_009368 [Blastocladiella emersonii ATCC 22665]